MGPSDLRGERRRRLAVAVGVGRSLVLEPATVQGVRGEERFGSDPLQRRLRFLLQSLPARPLRDHPRPLQRRTMDQLEGGPILLDNSFGVYIALLPFLFNAPQ